MIDFDKIDQKKVLILCKHPEGITVLSTFLQEKGFEVNLQKVPGDFFQCISHFNPGFVMISNEMNIQMGKVFPHFIQKKFNLPVLLFPETSDKGSVNVIEGTAKTGNAGVRALHSKQEDHVLDELQQFEGRYKAQVGALQKTTDKVNLETLRKARHKRQTALFHKLSDKIKVGLPVLMRKEELEMVAVKIADPSGQGSFLIFTELPAGQTLKELREHLAREIDNFEGQSIQVESLEYKMPNETVLQFKANADKAVHGYWGEVPISVFYYMDSKPEHHEHLTLVDGGYLIPVEDWWNRIPLTFDAYIHLKHNDKVLMYLHRGSTFADGQLKNFISRKQHLWVRGDDFHNFELMSELTGLLSQSKKLIAVQAA